MAGNTGDKPTKVNPQTLSVSPRQAGAGKPNVTGHDGTTGNIKPGPGNFTGA